MRKDSDWRLFEQAVETFLRALDPTAKVVGDVRLPDRHTGSPRQRDVWIETTAVKLFPIKILVSCKRYTRKLSSKDVDAFHGELLSSSAHKGVLYSYSGYTGPAIRKAEVLGISCCKLYQNEPAQVPSVLLFPNCYASYPQVVAIVRSVSKSPSPYRLWKDMLHAPAEVSAEGVRTVSDVLGTMFEENERKSVLDANKNRSAFPFSWRTDLRIMIEDENHVEVGLTIAENWIDYVAQIEAHLVSGTYSFSDKTFVGSQTTPSLDAWGSDPGPGWTRIDGRPKPPGNILHFTRGVGKIFKSLLEVHFGDLEIIVQPE